VDTGRSGPPLSSPLEGPSGGKTGGPELGFAVTVYALAGVIFGLARNDVVDDSVQTTTPDVPRLTIAAPEVRVPVDSVLESFAELGHNSG
jgi:hypothetical protein